MALTDVDGVYGSPAFTWRRRSTGIQAHMGAEITVHGWRPLSAAGESRTGYQNLCRLITRMKLRRAEESEAGHEAAATPEDLAEFSEG